MVATRLVCRASQYNCLYQVLHTVCSGPIIG